MLKLVKSPKAEEDLIDIWLYIADDQPVNADRYLDKLNTTAIALANTPGMGVDRLELGAGIKSFPIDDYILYYRLGTDAIELIRVLSAYREVSRIYW